MTRWRRQMASVLVLTLAAGVGAGIFYIGTELPFMSRPRSPGNDLGRLMDGLLLGMALGFASGGLVASTLLKKHQLPFAQVPWYVWSLAGFPLWFVVADILL